MRRSKSASISNAAIIGLLGLAVLTVGVLGALLYGMRSRKPAAVAQTEPAQPQHSLSRYIAGAPAPAASAPTNANEDAPVIRLAARSNADESTTAPVPTVVPAPSTPVLVENAKEPPAIPASTHIEPAALPPTAPPAANSKDSNELIGEITGPSYTAKKAMSGGAAPNNKPNGRAPDAKKPPVPPVPPKTPAKPEPPKTGQPPGPPPPPPFDRTKMDFSHAPVFVLNDGRRIRAVAVRDNGATLTIKNEAGTDITFKKTDVKEILRS